MAHPKQSAPRRSSLMPLYLILGVVALLGVVVIGRAVFKKKLAENANQPVPVDVSASDLNQTPGISIGSPNAPVTLLEFADFQCPHCARFATTIMPLVQERLVQTGKVRFVFYEFPLGGNFAWSFLAARSGRCANEQGKFWTYHDRLFGQQSEWSYQTDINKVIDLFAGYAEMSGLDKARFETCLRSDKYAKEVSQSKQLGLALQVEGTPTFIVNGKRLANVGGDFAQFEAALNEASGGLLGARKDSASSAAAPAAGAADSATPR